MDKRYIELGQAKRALSDEAWYNPYFRQEEYVINVLNKLPAADVAPVVHAHWVHDETGWYYCSHCRKCWLVNDTAALGHKYCSKCGAKMDEGASNA